MITPPLRSLRNWPRALLAPACFALLLAGCASAPQERFYTLQAPVPENTASAPASALKLVLANLTLPDSVDKPQLVIRKNAQQVQILEQQRWAAPLKATLAQALASNLRAQGVQMDLRTEHGLKDNAWQLWLDVLQFESRPGQEAVLEVQWQVRNQQGMQVLVSRKLWREAPGDAGIEALVAAHQRALQQCAQEMARSLQRLPSPAASSVGNTRIDAAPVGP